MDAKKSDKLGKVFVEAIKGAIGGNRQHGWGQADSMDVIDAVVAEDAADAPAGKYSISDEARPFIERVINPSACRQWLESKEVNLLDKAKEPARGRVSGLSKLFASK
jgi:hypothetical protein